MTYNDDDNDDDNNNSNNNKTIKIYILSPPSSLSPISPFKQCLQ